MKCRDPEFSKAIFRFFEPTTGTGQWQSVASLDANCLVDIDRFKTFGRPLGVEEIPLPYH